MTTRWRKLGIRATAGLAVAAAPVAAACSSGPSYEDWAATDGAAGRINLEDVQNAFQESESVTEFEKRVNEIFEGDGLVLIKAEQTDTAFVLEGWENLDGNIRIDEGTDEKLFTITEKDDKSHEMRGHHANSYYHSSFGAGNFLFTYLLLSSFAGPRYVYVPPHPAYPQYPSGELTAIQVPIRARCRRTAHTSTSRRALPGRAMIRSSARQSYQFARPDPSRAAGRAFAAAGERHRVRASLAAAAAVSSGAAVDRPSSARRAHSGKAFAGRRG